MPHFFQYHLHTDYSLLDSTTKFEEYIELAKRDGYAALASTEHGLPRGWVSKKLACDKAGIKFVHGCEVYLTEQLEPKVRDNYHTVLLAKNMAGVKELNRLLSLSSRPDHYYYTNRITFDEFLGISDNIVTTSACLASPLNKLDDSHPRYMELARKYDYLEVQPHNSDDQRAFNRRLLFLSQEIGIPLIAGTDTHNASPYKAECRSLLMRAKRHVYSDEDSYNLNWRTYDELVAEFEEQGTLPEQFYTEAIENTNVLANSIEDFKLDQTIRYPILHGSYEKDEEVFVENVEKSFTDKLKSGIIPPEQEESFKAAIKEELEVFQKLHMSGFMQSMSELVRWCKGQDIAIGFARGSVGGSRIAYLTDIIDLNGETWHTVFSRFANVNRAEIGDIDIDLPDEDRPAVFNYITQRFGAAHTAKVASYGTIADLGFIDDAGRALMLKWNAENPDSTDKNPYSMDRIKGIKKSFKNDPEEAKKACPELFYYYDGMIGTRVSQSVHPAGVVIFPLDVDEEFCSFDKDGDKCLVLDMDEVHEVGAAKYDFLGLKNVKVIRNVYKEVGIPYPKSHEINWNDAAVWNDMLDSPVGLFQMEGSYAFDSLKKFKPRNMFELALVAACIRPSGASYRDDLLARKPHKNPSKLIDDLLVDNNGYLVFQEDVNRFLCEVCGMSGSDADNVRRGIARKKTDILDAAMPRILKGYCSKSDQPIEVSEGEAKEFIQIISDASSYMFGYNHAIAYSMTTYICAYLRHYYPTEFIVAELNTFQGDEEKTNAIIDYAAQKRIKVTSPRFGASSDEYNYNKELGVIAKGAASIKFMNKQIAQDLYAIGGSRHFDNFMDVLLALKETDIDARQTDILIKVGYFCDYGGINELIAITDWFYKLKKGDAKQLKRESISVEAFDVISPSVSNINDKGEELKTYKVVDAHGLLVGLERYVKSQNLPEPSWKERAEYSKDFLGYVDITTGKDEDRQKLYITSVYGILSKNHKGVWKYSLRTKSIGTGKTGMVSLTPYQMENNIVREGDIVYASFVRKDKHGYWQLVEYKVVG